MLTNRRRASTMSFHEKQVSNEYFQWLCDQVDVGVNEYWLLAQSLHKKKFYSLVDYDENRALDGLALRARFAEESGHDEKYLALGPCSVLEMLFALAERLDEIMADINNSNNVSKWFWELIENLRLERFTDDSYYDLNGTLAIDGILNIFLSRTYNRNGMGGLFPLKSRPKEDQRKVEIWYQMNKYLFENYYLEEEGI